MKQDTKNIMFASSAKKKVCPFIILNEPQNGGLTPDEMGIFKNAFCLTGDCMAWQYVKDEYVAVGTHLSVDTNEETERGYCLKIMHGSHDVLHVDK